MDGAGGADTFSTPPRPARSRSGCQGDADAATATLCKRRGQRGSVLLARESLELPKPDSLGLVLWKVRKALMEKREQEEQSRAAILFIYLLLICCFFFFLRKLQFGVKMYFTVVKSMNFPLPATHLAEVGGLERQQDGRAGGGLSLALGHGPLCHFHLMQVSLLLLPLLTRMALLIPFLFPAAVL